MKALSPSTFSCVLILLILALLSSSASAVPFRNRDPGNKLTASDAADGDVLGWSVGVSGNLAIVGAYGEDGTGMDQGAAYVYDLISGAEIYKLRASDAEDNDQFGYSVAISGNLAIVGARDEDGVGGNNRGAAYVYDLTTGVELHKLTASDASNNDQFGHSVAISGNLAIVGSRIKEAAYVYDLSTGMELFKFVPPVGQSGDSYGASVGISGNLAIVGAYDYDGNGGNNQGAVYVYDLTTGTELYLLTASDAETSDNLGEFAAIAGNVAVVGAPLEGGDGGFARGAAYVFDLATGAQRFKLTASDPEDSDFFGGAVSASGNLAVVGAWGEDGSGNFRGAAYVFDLSTGNELFKLTASDAEDLDIFGNAVGVSEGLVVVGARSEDGAGDARGAAYVYEIPTYQPDNRVGSGPLTGVGDNIYNTGAAGQTLVRTSRNLARVNGYVTVGSDGDSGDDLTVSATPGNSNFSVVYRRSSGGVESNITAALVAGTHVERNVVSDEPGRSIRAEIIPSSRLRKKVKVNGKRVTSITRRTFNGRITSVSGVHDFKQDTVGIRVTTK